MFVRSENSQTAEKRKVCLRMRRYKTFKNWKLVENSHPCVINNLV